MAEKAGIVGFVEKNPALAFGGGIVALILLGSVLLKKGSATGTTGTGSGQPVYTPTTTNFTTTNTNSNNSTTTNNGVTGHRSKPPKPPKKPKVPEHNKKPKNRPSPPPKKPTGIGFKTPASGPIVRAPAPAPKPILRPKYKQRTGGYQPAGQGIPPNRQRTGGYQPAGQGIPQARKPSPRLSPGSGFPY